MSSSKEYEKLLKQQAYMDAITNKAYTDLTTKKSDLSKPKEFSDKEINFERNVAESYLKSMAPDSIIPDILNYLEGSNNFSDFNKYQSVFKKAIGTNKIASVGQFITMFSTFQENILSDIEKSGLFPQEEIRRDIDQVISAVQPMVITDLLNEPEDNIEKQFKEAFIKEKGKEPENGDEIESMAKVKMIKYTLYDVDKPIIGLKVASRQLKPETVRKIKIKYILKVNNPDYIPVLPRFMKWDEDLSESLSKSGVGSGFHRRSNRYNVLVGSGLQKKKAIA